MSSHFCSLKVKSIENTTEDSVVVAFEMPTDQIDEFQFTQGQYLTLKANIEGEDVQRSYSLCSSPLDNEWKVAIKKVPFGKFSTYANETLEPGANLEVMPPNGKFFVEVNPDIQRNHIAFAAGSVPNQVTPAHHKTLREHFSERQTVEIVATIAIFGFLNRWNDSMATKLEDEPLQFAQAHLSATWDAGSDICYPRKFTLQVRKGFLFGCNSASD